jgi:hypothetical protein
MPSSPHDCCRADQENRRHRGRASDYEEVGHDRTDHRRHECQGPEHRERGHEQRKRRTDFDEAGEVAEPLTDADGVEQPTIAGAPRSFEPPASRNIAASASWTAQSAMRSVRPRRTGDVCVSDGANDIMNLL